MSNSSFSQLLANCQKHLLWRVSHAESQPSTNQSLLCTSADLKFLIRALSRILNPPCARKPKSPCVSHITTLPLFSSFLIFSWKICSTTEIPGKSQGIHARQTASVLHQNPEFTHYTLAPAASPSTSLGESAPELRSSSW